MKKILLASALLAGALNANVIEAALSASNCCNGEGHETSVSRDANTLLVKYEKGMADLVLDKALTKSGLCNGEGHSTDRDVVASNTKLNDACPIQEAMNNSWSDEV